MLHISGQIDIVNHDLCELFSPKYEHKSYREAAGRLIRKHQNLIALSNDIENLFSYIALMQFFTNTLVICCIAVVIVTVSVSCWTFYFVTYHANAIFVNAHAYYSHLKVIKDTSCC